MEDIGRPWMDVKVYETHWNYHFQGSKTTRYPLTLYILTPRYILEWLWMRCIPGGWRPSTQNVGEGFGLQTSGGWTLGHSGPQWLWKEYHSTYLAGALGALAENHRWIQWRLHFRSVLRETFGLEILEHVRSMFGACSEHINRGKSTWCLDSLCFFWSSAACFAGRYPQKSGRIGRASRLIERSHTLSHLASDNSKHGITYHGWVNHWWYSHIFTFNPIGTIPSHQKHGVSCALWRTSVAIS